MFSLNETLVSYPPACNHFPIRVSFSPTFEVFKRVFTWSRLVVCSPGNVSFVCGYNTVAAEWVLIEWIMDSQNGCWIECQTKHLNLEELYLHKVHEDSVEFLYTLHPSIAVKSCFHPFLTVGLFHYCSAFVTTRNSPWYITIKSTWFIQSSRGFLFSVPGCHPGLRLMVMSS